MQTRNRFSGAFGRKAPEIGRQLLIASETAARWPASALENSSPVSFAYLIWPGAMGTPRFWQDATGQVTVAADAKLWDAVAVRASLLHRGCQLRTNDDGELLLHLYLLYGADLGRHCRGMFVAAIADTREPGCPRLLLIRDPLGGRGALYYAQRDNGLAFSSTLRSLRRWTALPLEPDLVAIRQYLTCAFLPGEETLLAGCRELLPGHTLLAEYDQRGYVVCQVVPYWSLAEQPWDAAAPIEEYARPLRTLLEDTVAERLPSAGSTAVLLSGGLDSSAITALAARAAPGPLHTFSISFGPEYRNELPFSRMVAEHCRTRHTELVVSGTDIAAHLEETTARLDGPIGDPLTVPNFLLDRAASQVSDVVLNGEGGDPCFGGPKNPAMLLHELYGDTGSALGARERNYLRAYQKCYDDLPQLLTPRAQHLLAAKPPLEEFLTPYFSPSGIASYLNLLMNINIRLKGSHQILYKVDRMTAAWGLEGRSPLFDRRVAEFSFGVPPHFKRAGNDEKFVLKRAVWDLLPEPILTRPKSGMLVPVQGWFRGELKGLATDLLLGKRARQREIINQAIIRSWLDYRGSLYPRQGVKLWLVLALELSLRLLLDAPRSAPVLPAAGRGL